jgi:membrane protein DedA with SNARE-associated domain
MGVRPTIFYVLDGFAALISVPVWVVGGWWVTRHLEIEDDLLLKYAKWIQIGIFAAVIAAALAYFIVRRIRRRRLNA